MGNAFDYAEVVIKTCTGDSKVLKFDVIDFLSSKIEAEQAASILRVIARSGMTVQHYQNGRDPDGWFELFPTWAHLTLVGVNGRNHLSSEVRAYETRTYSCAHIRAEEAAHGDR